MSRLPRIATMMFVGAAAASTSSSAAPAVPSFGWSTGATTTPSSGGGAEQRRFGRWPLKVSGQRESDPQFGLECGKRIVVQRGRIDSVDMAIKM